MNTETLTAIAEPTRLKIVEYLRSKPRSVGEIATKLKIRQPQASKHLKVLTEAGWLEVKPIAQQRIYQLQEKHFIELESWISSFQKLWEKRYEKLDSLLEELKSDQKEIKKNEHKL